MPPELVDVIDTFDEHVDSNRFYRHIDPHLSIISTCLGDVSIFLTFFDISAVYVDYIDGCVNQSGNTDSHGA
jgi:hypothetical protein